jgi:hypothetical protein
MGKGSFFAEKLPFVALARPGAPFCRGNIDCGIECSLM